jgi:hypothetical protein
MTEAPKTESLIHKNGLLLPEEAARELRRAPKTLAEWRCAGRGPRWKKIEGRILYAAVDIRSFIDGEG